MLCVYTFIHYGNGAAYDQERGSGFLCAAAGGRCSGKTGSWRDHTGTGRTAANAAL